ncbi:uncharacterized protein LOC115083936 isoform X2 [Rhinatrema bivittatum]|uniref:uncharacterized protein LOC115083936 isoform X2 n=1 Tax=Rhinatrema bivittatum TaxID=194408 RepID=UPI00112620CD|nr:uncharacterized protein LOC115083936 isoform X2 [Rhinatrema bivittatum]
MSSSKQRKVDLECRLFNPEWQAKYFFIVLNSKPICLICQENIAVLKKYNLYRHFTTKHPNYASNLTCEERAIKAERLAAKLKTQQKSFVPQATVQEAIAKASYVLAFRIAKENKPFADGEFLKRCLVDVARLLCPEYQARMENLCLSRKAIARCIEVIDEELVSELTRKARYFTLFSLAFSGSPDLQDTAELLVFVRGIDDKFEITEEFLTVVSRKGMTGLDLYEAVSGWLERVKLPWSKLANVTTDGSLDLTGENGGLLKRIGDRVKELDPMQELTVLHCILHQVALCKNALDLDHVLCTVVKIVKCIRARAFDHYRFISLFESTDAEHLDHRNVGWLNLGKALQQVWKLRDEISHFLALEGKAGEFPELKDSSWVCDLAFGVDIMAHLNEFNMKLRGKNLFVHELYPRVKAFQVMLLCFARELKSNVLVHFATLQGLEVSPEQAGKYSQILSEFHVAFSHQFADFEGIESTLELVSCPLLFDYERAPEELQLELIDLQCDSTLKKKYNAENLGAFYASLSATKFPNICREAQKTLVFFGSTYVCEQTFSVLKCNRAHSRSHLSDHHLSPVMRISTTNLTPDFDAIVKRGEDARGRNLEEHPREDVQKAEPGQKTLRSCAGEMLVAFQPRGLVLEKLTSAPAHPPDLLRGNAHKCAVCGKWFKYRQNLVAHERTHTGKKPFPCTQCERSFTLKRTLRIHRETHSGEKLLPCPDCGKCFAGKHGLGGHRKVHMRAQLFACPECGQRVATRENLLRHMESHAGQKPHTCSECGKRFTRTASLKCHLKMHWIGRPYRCTKCGRRFDRRSQLDAHEKLRCLGKHFVCEACGKTFQLLRQLKAHYQSYCAERRRRGNSRSGSEQEENIPGHAFKPETSCESTGEAMGGNGDCHRGGLHQLPDGSVPQGSAAAEAPHVCNVCGKSFQEWRRLVEHEWIHTGEELFLCFECGRRFRSRAELNCHLRRHTESTPYICTACGMSFTQWPDLMAHQRMHLGETPATAEGLVREIKEEQLEVRIIKIESPEEEPKNPAGEAPEGWRRHEQNAGNAASVTERPFLDERPGREIKEEQTVKVECPKEELRNPAGDALEGSTTREFSASILLKAIVLQACQKVEGQCERRSQQPHSAEDQRRVHTEEKSQTSSKAAEEQLRVQIVKVESLEEETRNPERDFVEGSMQSKQNASDDINVNAC